MYRLVRRFRDWSKLKNISLIFFSLIILHICGFIMCYEDLTFRLPRDVVPMSYAVKLHPDFSTELFNGEVAIAIEIFAARQFIAVHAKDLTITSTRLTRYVISDAIAIVIGDMVLQRIIKIDEFEMIVVETKRIMEPGNYHLVFGFNGTMSKDKTGFFMSSFFDPYTDETRKIAATRFEPTHARRAFPCFDEPGFKSVFHIHLVQPNIRGYFSLSNMPIEYVEPGFPLPELTMVHFAPSLPMPTYHVAFVITDLDYLNAMVAERWENFQLIPIRAWTTIENSISLDLALHMIYRALELYMRLFRSNYPMPKIDTIAIPGLQWGSTENWGLITYGESSMLYFGRSNSVTDLKISANHIAYGLVHMWFGNLVSIDWWDNAWLPKSFATYMQYYTTQWNFPDWKELDNFLVDSKFPSMQRDALITSVPIVQSANSPKEVHNICETIPYQKGASIIRMLYYMMGEDNFFYGVAHYLHAYQLSSAGLEHFSTMLQYFHTHANENLTQFVHTWTRQPGFPVINVERINDTFFINQTRFIWNNMTSHNQSDSPYMYHWDLLIFYTTSDNDGTKRMSIPHNSRKVQLMVEKQVSWVKFNFNSIGYFIVNYDIRSWENFVDILTTRPETFEAIDRADLINDAFMNADAGTTPYSIPMSMLNCMRFETEHVNWQLVSDKLLSIHTILRGTGVFTKFEEFVTDLISSMYQMVGWYVHQMNHFLQRRLRITILKLACAVGMKHCIDEATNRFRFWLVNPSIRPHPDLKEIVYYYGMSFAGGIDEWNIVYNLFISEPDAHERHRLRICLTAINDPVILINYLEIAKNPSIMSPDDYLETIHDATLNPTGSFKIWDFYKTNWIFLSSRYTTVDQRFARLIIPVTSKFRETYKFYEILQFFNDHPNGELSNLARKEAEEIMRNNLIWMERNYAQIKNWLDAI